MKSIHSRAWLGLLFGMALGLHGFGIGHAAADKCDKACKCQDKCTEAFKSCSDGCNSAPEDERASCVLKCNDTLLKCMGRCGGQECDCGGY